MLTSIIRKTVSRLHFRKFGHLGNRFSITVADRLCRFTTIWKVKNLQNFKFVIKCYNLCQFLIKIECKILYLIIWCYLSFKKFHKKKLRKQHIMRYHIFNFDRKSTYYLDDDRQPTLKTNYIRYVRLGYLFLNFSLSYFPNHWSLSTKFLV